VLGEIWTISSTACSATTSFWGRTGAMQPPAGHRPWDAFSRRLSD
jgi:hypothetical protein